MCLLLNHGEREITERSYYKLVRKCLETRNVYVATDLVSSDEPFSPFVYFVISSLKALIDQVLNTSYL